METFATNSEKISQIRNLDGTVELIYANLTLNHNLKPEAILFWDNLTLKISCIYFNLCGVTGVAKQCSKCKNYDVGIRKITDTINRKKNMIAFANCNETAAQLVCTTFMVVFHLSAVVYVKTGFR